MKIFNKSKLPKSHHKINYYLNLHFLFKIFTETTFLDKQFVITTRSTINKFTNKKKLKTQTIAIDWPKAFSKSKNLVNEIKDTIDRIVNMIKYRLNR